MTTESVQGQRVCLLSTTGGPTMTVDLWEDFSHPAGHDFRTGAVVTVRPGVSYDSAQPFIPYAALYALAWETEPDADPVARFEEALAQERLRAEERLTGAEGLARAPRR